jgi:hypothetical protein
MDLYSQLKRTSHYQLGTTAAICQPAAWAQNEADATQLSCSRYFVQCLYDVTWLVRYSCLVFQALGEMLGVPYQVIIAVELFDQLLDATAVTRSPSESFDCAVSECHHGTPLGLEMDSADPVASLPSAVGIGTHDQHTAGCACLQHNTDHKGGY